MCFRLTLRIWTISVLWFMWPVRLADGYHGLTGLFPLVSVTGMFAAWTITFIPTLTEISRLSDHQKTDLCCYPKICLQSLCIVHGFSCVVNFVEDKFTTTKKYKISYTLPSFVRRHLQTWQNKLCVTRFWIRTQICHKPRCLGYNF